MRLSRGDRAAKWLMWNMLVSMVMKLLIARCWAIVVGLGSGWKGMEGGLWACLIVVAFRTCMSSTNDRRVAVWRRFCCCFVVVVFCSSSPTLGGRALSKISASWSNAWFLSVVRSRKGVAGRGCQIASMSSRVAQMMVSCDDVCGMGTSCGKNSMVSTILVFPVFGTYTM